MSTPEDHKPDSQPVQTLHKADAPDKSAQPERLYASVDKYGADMLVCLDRNLDEAVIDAIATATPRQAVCLDAGFNSNDELKTNAVQSFTVAARHAKREIQFRTI